MKNYLSLPAGTLAATLFAVTTLGWGVPAEADTFTVINLNEDGAGSLDQAMTDAIAAPGDDNIVFDAGLNGTIIGDSFPDVAGDGLTIDGDSRITISGVLPFTLEDGGSLTLENLTVNDGVWGAIINLSGDELTLINTTISNYVAFVGLDIPAQDGSAGGAIQNWAGGTVTVINSTLSNNHADLGGAIFNSGGTVTITNSTFNGNTSSEFGSGTSYQGGGAVYNYGGIVTIINSTLIGNRNLASASNLGGGAIYNLQGTMTITNSTLSENFSAWGGAIYNNNAHLDQGILTITNSTIINNEGYWPDSGVGIRNSGVVTLVLSNSILAGNIVTSVDRPSDCNIVSGVFTDGGHNLVEDGSCITVGSNGNLDGDPMLKPLADNGGDTQTHSPFPGSPVVDAGDDAICAADPVNNLDQRGYARPIGAACDIGSVEFSHVIFNNGFEAGNTGGTN